jgi:hypothetical protein
MGITTRLFVADAEWGWRRLALNAGYLAFHGALPLPEFADQTITVAFAHVEVKGPRVIRLLRVERARWRFDLQGEFDSKFARAESHSKYWPRTVAEVFEARQFSATELESLLRHLGVTS